MNFTKSTRITFFTAAAGIFLLLLFLQIQSDMPEDHIINPTTDLVQNDFSEGLLSNDLGQSQIDKLVEPVKSIGETDHKTNNNEVINEPEKSTQQLQLARSFSEAESALDAEKAAWEISNFDPDLADRLIMNLSDFCSVGRLGIYPEGLQQKNQSFCKNFQLSTRAKDLSPEELIQSDPFLRMEVNLEHRLERSMGESKTEVFTQLILNSNFPEQIDMLMGINYRHQEASGEPLWQLGSDTRKDRYPAANLMNSQITALTLFRCARFGGCGENHYYTAHYCATTMGGACEAEDTLEQMLYSITRPVDFALAQEILAELFRSR